MSKKVWSLPAVFGLGLIACTHFAKREPAQVVRFEGQPTCEMVTAGAFNVSMVDEGISIEERAWERAGHYLKEQFPAMIRAFMEKAAQDTSCEVENDVPRFEADIKYRIEFLNGSIKSSTGPASVLGFAHSALFTDATFADQLACYGICSASRARPTCAKTCGVTQAFNDLYWTSPAPHVLSGVCFGDVTPQDRDEKQKKFISDFNAARDNLAGYLKSKLPMLEAALAEKTSLRDDLMKLQAEYKIFVAQRKPRKCPVIEAAWAKKVRKSTIRLQRHSSLGTAFYVKAPSGRFLVTAAHVVGLDTSSPSGDSTVMTSEKGGLVTKRSGKVETFSIVPGMHDKERDINFKNAPGKGEALEVARADEIPHVGQKFFVNGFPGVAEGKYMTYECTFIGFGPAMPDRKDVAYELDCPGRPELGGISGGPAVDENGKVWGVNSAAPKYSSHFSVAPLSVGTDGLLKIGIQQVFLSDNCFSLNGAGSTEPHRCQIMPRQLEESIP
jgi:hypothetical protein